MNKRKIRSLLIGSAAFVVMAALPGCGQVQSMLGMSDSDASATSTRPPARAPSLPITTIAHDTNHDSPTAAPAEANRGATVGTTASAMELAYADSSDSVALPPPPVPTPREVNVYGELDGKPRPTPRGVQQVNFQQHTTITEGQDGEVSVDPSGRWMLFTSTRHSKHPQIYLQRVDGTSVIQLTSDNADYAFPKFSPDGRQIAFASTRAGNWDIYVMDADGRNVTQVTSGPAQDLHPSFSPDGQRLVYCSLGSKSGQWELWTVNTASSERRMIGYGLFPSWSPAKDRDRVAFQRPRQRGSRWFSLWTLDLIDDEARNITEVAVSDNAAIVSPAWSPDGSRIAFTTIVNPTLLSRDGAPGGQQDVWTVNADGGDRRRVTDGNGINSTPFWASDNRLYFVSNRNGTECIWSANANVESSTRTIARDNKTSAAPGMTATVETTADR